MRFLVIIILFIFAVIASTVLAKLALRGNLEAEMLARAHTALSGAGYSGVAVKFDHLHAEVGGYLENPDDKAKVLALLRETLPAAYWPEADATAIKIRPTLPPRLVVTRAGNDEAKIEGVLALSDEEGRNLLASRIHALPGISEVRNEITFDPRQLPFAKMAEFASLASGLLAHSKMAEVSFQNGKLKIEGTVPNDGIRASLLELASEISAEGRTDLIVVEVPDTFRRTAEFKLTRNRFGITLQGTLPNEADKAALLAALKSLSPAPTISDRLTVATDLAPAPWQGVLPVVLPVLLQGLSGEMTAEFSETQIRLHGSSPDESTFRTLEAGLAPLGALGPAMVVVADLSIAAPAAEPGAGQSLIAVYEGDLLILSGKLSDEAIPGRIEAKLTGLLPRLSVKNEVETIATAPGHDWTARLPDFFAESLTRVQNGVFRFTDTLLAMEGRTLGLPDKQIIQNIAVNTVPASFSVRNDLLHVDTPVPKPPLTPELRETLAAALKESPVYFQIGSEVLKEGGETTLASLVELLKKAKADLSLVVTGVSDDKGNVETNRELSLKRAATVVAELERLGLEVSSIETASFVENVSNVPRSQRWKARRVDISLKPAAEAATAP